MYTCLYDQQSRLGKPKSEIHSIVSVLPYCLSLTLNPPYPPSVILHSPTHPDMASHDPHGSLAGGSWGRDL